AVGNTYYMGAMLKNDKEPEQKEWANSVNMLFPNTGDRGTHVNISGAIVAKNAPHKDNAVKLIEFLASDEGQKDYAEVNNEYPVKDGVPWSALVQSWGNFKADPISLNELAAARRKASELVDKVDFDAGPSSGGGEMSGRNKIEPGPTRGGMPALRGPNALGAERLVGVGFRCWLAGYQYRVIGLWGRRGDTLLCA